MSSLGLALYALQPIIEKYDTLKNSEYKLEVKMF